MRAPTGTCVGLIRRHDVVLRGGEGRRLRKVGSSKERRVDPQVVVGLLVDRGGFPLDIGCFAGNKAETATIIPILQACQSRHQLADMVVVADAGMLSATNLRELDQARLRFIVGSRVTKASADLASHFRWHGHAFSDGQLIDTITPKTGHTIQNSPPLQENRAKAVVAGEKAAGMPRFVKTSNAHGPWTRRPWPGPDGWSGSRGR